MAEKILRYRLDLTSVELEQLRRVIDEAEAAGVMVDAVRETLEGMKIIEKTLKKSVAARKATEVRQKKTREKIQNALNILRLENKEPTAFRVSKISGVAFSTAQKYLDRLENE